MKTLSLIDKAFILKKNVLFSELDLDLLLVFADKMPAMHFSQEEILFYKVQEATKMYFIVEGTIWIKDAKDNSYILKPGDFFGEEALFNDKPRAYDAKVSKDSLLISLSKTHLLTIISECPSVAISLLQVYTSKIEMRQY